MSLEHPISETHTEQLNPVLKMKLLQEWSPIISYELDFDGRGLSRLCQRDAGSNHAPADRTPQHSLTNKSTLDRFRWQFGELRSATLHVPVGFPLQPECSGSRTEDRRAYKLCIQTISHLSSVFVIFIHSKISICDNSVLFIMKREHHCLNMGKVQFSTLEVNDSIFKLIREGKEVCKSSLSCSFYKEYYLKIMNSKD